MSSRGLSTLEDSKYLWNEKMNEHLIPLIEARAQTQTCCIQ